MKAFYLYECPIDGTEWTVDVKRMEAGYKDIFGNVHTGRAHEEHPNTNKIIAARNREQMKAQRAREERRAKATQEGIDVEAQWTNVAMPAWERLK